MPTAAACLFVRVHSAAFSHVAAPWKSLACHYSFTFIQFVSQYCVVVRAYFIHHILEFVMQRVLLGRPDFLQQPAAFLTCKTATATVSARDFESRNSCSNNASIVGAGTCPTQGQDSGSVVGDYGDIFHLSLHGTIQCHAMQVIRSPWILLVRP